MSSNSTHVLRVGKRHYKPTDLGPKCPICGTRMVMRLVEAAIGIHPTCNAEAEVGPSWHLGTETSR